MTNTKDVILALKKVKEEKNLSLDKILVIMEENDQFVSKSTLSRVFRDGSEEQSFNYEGTLRPIANALLDIDTIEADDDIDTRAYKSILQLKMSVIDENSRQIAALKDELESVSKNEKNKYYDKLMEETERFQRTMDFAKNQIALKDKRIDQLLDANMQLLNQLLNCPCRTKNKILDDEV